MGSQKIDNYITAAAQLSLRDLTSGRNTVTGVMITGHLSRKVVRSAME